MQYLVIITTNRTKFCSQEFSKIETPDFEVAQAIKISSSMPGLMAPYEYEGSFLVDGDLQKASPMWRLSENLKKSKSRILEFRLEGDFNKDEKNPISFINTIYSCVTDVATDFVNEIYGQNDRFDCIRINTGDVFFADFNLDKDNRRKLIDIGYNQTIDYFKNVLPQKKQKLDETYSNILDYLRRIQGFCLLKKFVAAKNSLSELFIYLTQVNKIIDSDVYNAICLFQKLMFSNIKSGLLGRSKCENYSVVSDSLNNLISDLTNRCTELEKYINKFSD